MTYFISEISYEGCVFSYTHLSEKDAWAFLDGAGAGADSVKVYECTSLKQIFKDGWIPWSGGECPCPNDMFKVRFRYEERNTAEAQPAWLGSSFRWDHQNSGGDIIEYKVVRSE